MAAVRIFVVVVAVLLSCVSFATFLCVISNGVDVCVYFAAELKLDRFVD